MQPGMLNLPPINKGATYRHQLVWKDSAGTPVNLTGCTGKLQVRPEHGDATVLLELTTISGGLTFGGALGTIDLYVSDEASEQLLGEGGLYDLEIYHPNGDTTRLVEGEWPFRPEITK